MTLVAVVTDIRHGPPERTKRGDRALPLLERFVTVANALRPDLALDLGDRITDEDAASDRRRAAEVAGVLAGLDAPLVSLHGNHDLDHLSISENAAILGQPAGHEAVALDGATLLAWRAPWRLKEWPGPLIGGEDQRWLAEAIAAHAGPLVVASHAPADDLAAQRDNPWFAERPDAATFETTAAVRAALAGREAIWLAGHVHHSRDTVRGGVRHVTLDSLVEDRGEGASGAFGLLRIEAGSMRWTVASVGRPARVAVDGPHG